MATADHLTALPSELIQTIASYLFASHDPDHVPITYPPHKQHDLEQLAATCRSLRHEVNAWAQSFMLQHQAITKYKLPDKKKLATQRKKNNPLPATALRHPTRYNQGLLSWSLRKCVFCGKPSSRAAIMVNSLRCCRACDNTHWSDKITRTEAKHDFGLSDRHLTAHRQYTTGALRKGMYNCQGRHTTLFMRDDVRRLAEGVHGDLKGYLNRRNAQREKWIKAKQAKARQEMRELEVTARLWQGDSPMEDESEDEYP